MKLNVLGLPKGYSALYGAYMGRSETLATAQYREMAFEFTVERVPLDSGGYDSGGAYWGKDGRDASGVVDPLWLAQGENDVTTVTAYHRAPNYAAALALVLADYPLATFAAPTIDDFATAFLEAALFSTNDQADENGGEPLNANHTIADIDERTLAALLAECKAFQADPAYAAMMAAESPCTRGHGEYSREEQAGHDFWFTSAGHGAGFWDGDWCEPHATALTDLAKRFGESGLYVGDDGKIYA